MRRVMFKIGCGVAVLWAGCCELDEGSSTCSLPGRVPDPPSKPEPKSEPAPPDKGANFDDPPPDTLPNPPLGPDDMLDTLYGVQLGPFVQVAMASEYECGLREAGVLQCWVSRHTPSWDSGVVAISGSNIELCALRDGGELVCHPDFLVTSQTVPASWTSFRVTPAFVCGQPDGGLPSCVERHSTTGDELDYLPGRPTLHAGGTTLCGIDAEGLVDCVNPPTSLLESRIDLGGPVTDIVVQDAALGLCGIVESSGQLVCGGGTESRIADPPADAVTQVALSQEDSSTQGVGCAVRAVDGRPVCWDALGSIAGLPNIELQQVALYERRACGLQTDGEITCWRF